MKNSDQPAFPVTDEMISRGYEYSGESVFTGLTKREKIAAMAMQGILANTNTISNVAYTPGGEVAKVSVAYADALLAELEKPKTATP